MCRHWRFAMISPLISTFVAFVLRLSARLVPRLQDRPEEVHALASGVGGEVHVSPGEASAAGGHVMP